jgi:hypothetical protein
MVETFDLQHCSVEEINCMFLLNIANESKTI